MEGYRTALSDLGLNPDDFLEIESDVLFKDESLVNVDILYLLTGCYWAKVW